MPFALSVVQRQIWNAPSLFRPFIPAALAAISNSTISSPSRSCGKSTKLLRKRQPQARTRLKETSHQLHAKADMQPADWSRSSALETFVLESATTMQQDLPADECSKIRKQYDWFCGPRQNTRCWCG